MNTYQERAMEEEMPEFFLVHPDVMDYLPWLFIVVPTLIALAVCLSGAVTW